MRKVSEVLKEIESLREYEKRLNRLSDSLKDKDYSSATMMHARLDKKDITEIRNYISVRALQLETRFKDCEVSM